MKKYGLGWFLMGVFAIAQAQLSAPLSDDALKKGSGAGYHSPESPFKPLPQRADVVAWSTLTDIKTEVKKDSIQPIFNAQQKALENTKVRVQGFMMPLNPAGKQYYFLLTSVPLTCAFCIPGGPESMIEVRAKIPVAYSLEPVVVEGKLELLLDNEYGLYYRLVDAQGVKN